MKKLLLTAIAAMLVVLVPACSYGTPTGTVNPTEPAGGNSISISNLSFSPSKLVVSAGTSVTWTNKDSTAHTITSTTGTFDSGNIVPGGSFTHTFNTTGTYDYACTLHLYMQGTVTVQ